MASRSNKTSTLAIIIPMFNEASGAVECVTQVMRVLPKLPWITKLIIIDDGSRDRTPKILVKLKQRYGRHLQILTHQKNRGYGASLVSGIRLAYKKKYTWCLFMDSDLTNPPSEIINFIQKAEATGAGAIKASRYIDGGKMAGVPYFRRLVSQLGNLFGRLCYRMGIHDYSNGFRLVQTKYLAGIPYREPGFALILEEMYYLKRLGVTAAEVPSVLTARTGTKSSFRYNFKTFWTYFKYAFKAALIL